MSYFFISWHFESFLRLLSLFFNFAWGLDGDADCYRVVGCPHVFLFNIWKLILDDGNLV